VMVRNLVLGNSMAAAYKHIKGFDLQGFWRYNLYTACCSRWLAQRANFNADLVFTLGLMHGVGQLQMHAVIPQAMVSLDRQMSVLDAGRASLELETLGFHFGQVSAELAQLWNFPQVLVDALRQVTQPLATPEFSEAAGWVHMGAWRSRAEVLGYSAEVQAAGYPVQVARQLQLDSAWTGTLGNQLPQDDATRMPALSELTQGLEAMFE